MLKRELSTIVVNMAYVFLPRNGYTVTFSCVNHININRA